MKQNNLFDNQTPEPTPKKDLGLGVTSQLPGHTKETTQQPKASTETPNYYDLLDERFQALDAFEKLIVLFGHAKAVQLVSAFGGGKVFYVPKRPTKRLEPQLSEQEQLRLIEALGAGERVYLPETSTLTKPILEMAIREEAKRGVKYGHIARRFGVSYGYVKKAVGG